MPFLPFPAPAAELTRPRRPVHAGCTQTSALGMRDPRPHSTRHAWWRLAASHVRVKRQPSPALPNREPRPRWRPRHHPSSYEVFSHLGMRFSVCRGRSVVGGKGVQCADGTVRRWWPCVWKREGSARAKKLVPVCGRTSVVSGGVAGRTRGSDARLCRCPGRCFLRTGRDVGECMGWGLLAIVIDTHRPTAL
jgi:hypothetical protein